MEPLNTWTAYVDQLPWCGGQLDESSWCAFLRAGTLGVAPETALATVLDHLHAAKSRVRPHKLTSQIARAYRYSGEGVKAGCLVYRQRPEWPATDPELIRSLAASGFGLADLAEQSPVRFEDNASHAEQIVDTLFPGNPLLCAGESGYRFATAARESWRGQLSELQFLVSSPMTALFGYTREGKCSAHSIGNTGSRRFLVVEFDRGELDEQAALLDYLARLGPLVLAVYSGNRSLHGWFYCQDAPEELLRRFMARAVRLGADLAMWRNRSQFARMPDGRRPNGNRQTIHYFNPEAVS